MMNAIYKTEVDIDLRLFQIDRRGMDSFHGDLYMVQFEVVDIGLENLFVRYKANEPLTTSNNDFGKIIIDFLLGVEQLLDVVGYIRGELRLGIYFNPRIIPAFSLHLSDCSIRKLSKYNISFEAILYPSDG